MSFFRITVSSCFAFAYFQLHLGSEQSVNQNDNVIKEEEEGEEGEGSPSKEPIDVSSFNITSCGKYYYY